MSAPGETIDSIVRLNTWSNSPGTSEGGGCNPSTAMPGWPGSLNTSLHPVNVASSTAYGSAMVSRAVLRNSHGSTTIAAAPTPSFTRVCLRMSPSSP